MSLYGSTVEMWEAFDALQRGELSGSRFSHPRDFLEGWRQNLEARVRDAADRLAELDGVVGLILAGGIGKGVPWPLSDIDIVAIYRSRDVEATREAVSDLRTRIESEWLDEGFPTGLDIRRIVYTDEEVSTALGESPMALLDRFDQVHWYHGADKAADGQVLYDEAGVTGDFLTWLTTARHLPEVIGARKARSSCPRLDDVATTRSQVVKADERHANLAVRELVIRFILYVTKGNWDDSGKLGRNCSRFERIAEEHGVGDLGRSLQRLIEPLPVDDERWASAPAFVHARHEISWPGRQATGEEISRQEDRRDVIDYFSNLGLSPGEMWSGTARDLDDLMVTLDRLEVLVHTHPQLQQ